MSKITWTDEKIIEFIENESDCKFLEFIEEKNNRKIKLLCGCGENIFITSFSKFLNRNKRQCNKCGFSIRNNKMKSDINFINQTLVDLGYVWLDMKFDSYKTHLTFIDKDGYKYFAQIGNLLQGKLPRKWHPSNPYTIENIKLWCKLNNKPFELLSDSYNGYDKKLKWKCLKPDCLDIFYCTWGDISNGKGCGVCHGKQVGLSNCLANVNPKLASEWHPTKNDGLTPYDVTHGSDKKIWWLCVQGHEWNAIVSSRNAGVGCPDCNQSKGEKEIEKYLKFNNVNYETQKTFEKCKCINPLLFDFYLSYYNLCIEYQGIQHYEPVDFASKGREWAEEQFTYTQLKDNIKREYCKSNNIKLLEIPYWDYDKIENMIKDILNIKFKEVI